MKKLVSVLAISLAFVAFAACNGGAKKNDSPKKNDTVKAAVVDNNQNSDGAEDAIVPDPEPEPEPAVAENTTTTTKKATTKKAAPVNDNNKKEVQAASTPKGVLPGADVKSSGKK